MRIANNTLTAYQKHTRSIPEAHQKHTQKHTVFSTIFCVSSCGGGNGQQRWPSHVFNKEIIKKIIFSGRAVPPDETQNIVENTICFCVCFWYASGMLLVCCWRCALQRQRYAVSVLLAMCITTPDTSQNELQEPFWFKGKVPHEEDCHVIGSNIWEPELPRPLYQWQR